MARKPMPLLDAARPVLPALKIVNHDLAHGSRRVTKRPWACDEYLNDLVGQVITKKGSIASVIQESKEFSDWYHQNKLATTYCIGQRVKNLSLARHRFDSTSKPLSRAVLSIYALVKTAEQIARLRRPGAREVIQAKEFLEYVDNERILQLAMLADGGLEALHLTRLCDSEEAAAEDLPWHVETLVQRLTLLVDGEILEVGHTKFIVEMLRKIPHQFFINGAPRGLGGPGALPRVIIHRCLGRMGCWVKLAQEVLEAEFPRFRALAAMGIFSLTAGNQKGKGSSDHLADHVERLAQFFNVDSNKFSEQLNDVHPFARTVKDSNIDVSNQEAWRMALKRIRGSQQHPVDALLRPLQCWVAWSPSTSGLEQNFSAMERTYGQRVSNLVDSGLLDLLTLVVEKKTVEARGEMKQAGWPPDGVTGGDD